LIVSPLLFRLREFVSGRRIPLFFAYLVLAASWQAAWGNHPATRAEPAGQVATPVVLGKEAIPSLRQLPKINLTVDTQRIDLSELTQFWLDESQETSVDAVEARASAGINLFEPSHAGDTHKAHGKTLWLRFDAHVFDTRSRWFLELDSPRIDDAQLFWRDRNNQWMSLKAGDGVPHNGWPIHTRLPTFALESSADSPQTYYLRIVNARSPVSTTLLIYRDTRLIEQQQNEMLLLGGFFGLIVIMLIASLGLAAIMRERSFLVYTAYIGSLALYMFCNVGLAAIYFWPNSPSITDRAVFVSASITAALGPLFVRKILQPVTRLRFTSAMIGVLVFLMLTMALFEAFHPTMFSYVLINLGTLTSLMVIYVVIFATWQRGDAITRMIALGFLPVALSAIPVILRNAGLIPNSIFTQYSLLFAGALEMPMLLYALLMRSANRRDTLMRAAGLPTRDALTGVSNIRALLDAMHGVMTRANRYKNQYALILVDLSNEAWFAKEHGQEIAERALVLLAVRMQQLTREVDVVSRIDKNQFVMLMEGPCTPRQVVQMTTRISASAHQPDDVLPVGSALKLKISGALMPNPLSRSANDDPHSQLGWLISQADLATNDPRKSVQTFGF
jgi:two-component system, sensor histidine kinase LadS